MRRLTLPIALLLVLALSLSVVLTGCGKSSTPSGEQPMEQETEPAPEEKAEEETKGETEGETGEEEQQEQQIPTEFSEAPMLAEKVKAGELPAVEERLPKQPKVTNEMPPELLEYEIGRYGGVLRTVTHSVNWDADVFVICNEPLINTPGILGEEFTPNVLRDYEVSQDQKEFTFYLREGLKWSDGHPVTTEDIRFTYEDVLLNEELTPVFPNYLKSGNKADGTPMKLDIIDDYTFKISFDEPYGGFLVELAIQGWRGYTDLLKPKHYLQQFHPKYTPEEELKKLIEEHEYETWVQLFGFKDITNWELTREEAIGFPVLYPWMLVSVQEGVYTFERNPYYFKVDPAGNQLPYIDKIVSTQVQDAEMAVMKQIAGEVDFARETMAMTKIPLYKENEKNGYTTYMAKMHVTPTDIFLNLTYEDPVWRQVVRDVRFRQALNYAIDKEEIIDSIYYGFAEASQMIPSEYDPDKANQLLDEMGLDKRDAQGFRLGPDGKRFTINFEIQNVAPDIVPFTELIVEFWLNVG
ncbi:MAG: ABC transporter substrate-binding protein, partial [Alcaligenaceae bacterium]|nr:ABC transporter substrate-binding protein [Alcaligenaceae bacterium]